MSEQAAKLGIGRTLSEEWLDAFRATVLDELPGARFRNNSLGMGLRYAQTDELAMLAGRDYSADQILGLVGSFCLEGVLEAETAEQPATLKRKGIFCVEDRAGLRMRLRVNDSRHDWYPEGYQITGEKLAVRGALRLPVDSNYRSVKNCPRPYVHLGHVVGAQKQTVEDALHDITTKTPRDVEFSRVDAI